MSVRKGGSWEFIVDVGPHRVTGGGARVQLLWIDVSHADALGLGPSVIWELIGAF